MANSVFISAMALAKMPSLLQSMRQMHIPDDITDALLVFSGNEEAIRRAVNVAGIPRKHLLPCVDAYIRNILLFDQAGPSRILGLNDASDEKTLRLHRKLLLERLHPDKSQDSADVIYARRVLEAWALIHASPAGKPPKKERKKPFVGPRVRWIRVPVEHLSLFHYYRKTKV